MLLPKEKLVGLNPTFVETLMRIAAKLPFALLINESVPANREGSHVQESEHYDGLGVDVSATDGYSRYMIVVRALEEGIHRIGVYDHHIHLGASKTLPGHVMWGGVSH